MNDLKPALGAHLLNNGKTRFRVWAPKTKTVEVHVVSPFDKYFPLDRDDRGYFTARVDNVPENARYLYRLDKGTERPDPASRFQPKGVHGPSAVIKDGFDWTDDNWPGLPLDHYIFYELHVGTFTPHGSFDKIISHLDYLVNLGITAIELMPVAQFPGTRNWGYDGVFPFAVQNSYGGPKGLKRLVNACHKKGLAVVLDVVYNHLGPEGNYLNDYGFYFSDRYHTPWGDHINFDGPYSDEVRRYFIENAVYWFLELHIDGLRLDAVHAIMDFSAKPFLKELAEVTDKLGKKINRRLCLFPESALNDARLIQSPDVGGFGLDAQWNDDFHHALHTVLTKENDGYYADFGHIDQMAKALTRGFVYDGTYSEFRKRSHGNYSGDLPGQKFIVFSQNHDQVGNRMTGDRLTRLVSESAVKLAAGVVLLSPYLPLLFMGEEYGETAPFPYFVSHSDPGLIQAVRNGRQKEFESFKWTGSPPDPQDPATFDRARLNRANRLSAENHQRMLTYYRRLIRLRKKILMPDLKKENTEVILLSEPRIICVRHRRRKADIFVVFYFAKDRITHTIPLPKGNWQKIVDNNAESSTDCKPVPRQIVSLGNIELSLSSHACLVFIQTLTPDTIEEFCI